MPKAATMLNRYLQEKIGVRGTYVVRRKVRARRIHHLKYARRKKAIALTWNVNDVLCLWRRMPLIVAGGHLGAHAVVAIGYRLRGAADRQICVLDPSAMRAEWRSTGELFVSDAEVIAPREEMFTKYRPGRVSRNRSAVKFTAWDPTNPNA